MCTKQRPIGRPIRQLLLFLEICSHPSNEKDSGLCKLSLNSTRLNIRDTFSVDFGITSGQHVALKGQFLSIMVTISSRNNHLTMGRTKASLLDE